MKNISIKARGKAYKKIESRFEYWIDFHDIRLFGISNL